MRLSGRVALLCLAFQMTAINEALAQTCRTSASDGLTVMTFNIHVGRGSGFPGRNPYRLKDEPERLAPVIAAIRSENPDIVGLQEVLADGQIVRLARALNMYPVFVPHPNDKERWWGVGLLSKCRPASVRSLPISAGKGNAKRAVLATIPFRDGSINILSAHKDKDLTDGSSFEAIGALANIATYATAQPVPTVIMGDFNARPWDARFKRLGRRFADTALLVNTPAAAEARQTGTWGGRQQKRIDYVFVDPTRFEVLGAGLVSPRFRAASDHFAYFARIRRRLSRR